ncbi:Phospholipid scramblase 2 [Holothuria leucospilota]|uniref:Phospholipid scramblase n=1 Tax=Holothuria leucospilota TaxID=206669 RepID=A0A9Q1HG34_HOLLE|nr:Phospholipid scramblase 2 [Holothuria leucospilota]
MRQCCGPKRGFTMHVVDNMNQEVLSVVRPFKCCSGYYWFAGCCVHCAYTLDVEAPPGKPIGHVRQRGSKWKPHFDILDADFNPVLKIRGPCCFCQGVCCTGDIEFSLMTPDDSQEIGKISKQWSGLGKELYTKADNFGITFPVDLNVNVKGTLLGALFLIDFMFFEQPNNPQTARR